MGVPVFETRPARCAPWRVLRLRRLQAEAQPVPGIAAVAPFGMTIANETQAKALLATAGVPVLPETCTSAENAAVARIGSAIRSS